MYHSITFLCCIFVTIPMDNYTHVAMCRVSAYICVYIVPVKCEKCSVKSEILGENS